MTPQTMDGPSVIERLEKLERQNRRMKQAGAVVLIMAAAAVLMGQAPATRTVEANEFVLKDANGRVRGEWRMNGDIALFTLLDSDGKARMLLAHDGGLDRPILQLRTADGNPRAILTLNSSQEPFLSLQGGAYADNLIAYLGPGEDGPALFRLFDKDGKVLWQAP